MQPRRACWRAEKRKAEPEHHVIEAPLQLLQQDLTGHTLCPRGFLKVVAELGFLREVHALRLLLFAQLQAVANNLGFPVFPVLSGSEVPLFDRALVAETFGAL